MTRQKTDHIHSIGAEKRTCSGGRLVIAAADRRDRSDPLLEQTTKCDDLQSREYSGPRLIWPPRARQKVATITGGLYYPEFLFSKKSEFLCKSGHINRLDILSVDILSGVYCT